MQKIISLFQRNYDGDRLVRDQITPGAEWVTQGEGRATIKWDGTCCLVRDGRLYKRYEVKGVYVDHVVDGREVWASRNDIPEDFEPADEVDRTTGKQQGWRPVGDGPGDRWHREAFGDGGPPDGTYELCGPKVQGNPDRFDRHVLISHGDQDCPGCPRSYELLKAFFKANSIEGVVWHHPDGRMVKIKGKDFGVKRSKGVPAAGKST